MRSVLAVVIATLIPISAASAQIGDSIAKRDEHSLTRPEINVRKASSPIKLDGRLDDPAWSGGDSITDFRQREPNEGAIASERTVVKILRDDDAIYIGARMYDRDAAALIATQLRRDTDLGSDDTFGFVIDSFHDRRGGFGFETNPNGAMYDAQANGAEDRNENWNGIWDVAVSRDADGWTAEFRIPFRTLRFNEGAGASLGFNARRKVRRRNEEDLWVSWHRNQGVWHFENEGDLVGLGVLSRERSAELKPYALLRGDAPAYGVNGARTADPSYSGKFGADAKVAVTPTLTADLTVNTDFAQAEADRQVVNLSRFPLFFPEKRDFFLESAGLFNFGTSGRAMPFYSRRIGLDPDGGPVPIFAGARLTGKAGPWAIGLLDARTGARDAANDAVVRIRHDLLDRSYVGGIFTNRSGPGVTGSQSTLGFDVDLPLVVNGRNVEPSFWINGTRTPGTAGFPLAWRVGLDYPNVLFDNFASLYRIASGYSPALGFVRRTGIWETRGHVDYMPRPRVAGLRNLLIRAPIPEWDIIADETGSLTDAKSWQTAELEWRLLGGTFQSGDQFELNLQRRMDAPSEVFEIFPDVNVAPGRYWWTRYELQFESSSGRKFSVHPKFSWGDFYDGNGTEVSLGATYRGGGHVILGGDITRDRVHLRGGSFNALSTGGRIEYAFTTRADFLAFAQYNNESKRADFNLRYHWTPVIGDDVYVVWNSGYSTDSAAAFRFGTGRSLTRPLNGALIVKAAHRMAF